ncbi:hypothetical protein PRUB_a0239 [Pseudoalteromonas rubra]|uniref:Response regulatory domain-containing protein n=1 Tax=Pseudoalteromonas rubra TaxID=43658 RepID=A0A8T0C777_9GAMM|nr:response regulator [Pseudoalteromonas rubra]KAF7785845.1 hypothetical protein PRUB_a0239 [Pseudoalteromonas rubra]
MKTLVVDSSAVMRRIVTQMLAQMGYQNTIQVDTCSAAFEELNKGEVDLIIADRQMTDMCCLEFAKAVRQGPYKDVNLLMMTLDGSLAEVNEARRAGIDKCVVKPFNFEGLKAGVEFFTVKLQG